MSLHGKRIVFTGTLSMTRKEATKLASEAGALVTGSISKSTDIIVAESDAASTAKVLTAKAFGTEIWSEKDFSKALLKAKPKAKAKAKAKGRSPKAKAVPAVKSQHLFLDHAKNKEFDKVMKLVKENAGYVNAQPAGRWTALHQAAEAGDKKVVKFLLEHKADVALQTNDGQKPIDVAKASVKDLLKVPGKRKAAAAGLDKSTDSDCRLHLFEPMSATELAEKQGGWFAGDNEAFCEEGVQHLHMKTAPAEAKSIAQDLQKAVKGAYMPAGESDCAPMVIVISNAGEFTASDAILKALAVLEDVDGEMLHTKVMFADCDFGEMDNFCNTYGDEDEEEEEEDEHTKKLKKATKIMAKSLTDCFHLNFEDGIICAPQVWGGWTEDQKHIVGILGMRVWT
ncbi:ligA [Symbiodinium sp. CCMP2592]|nr:ligA [Symbiodinium sp. CCMP2592]